MPRLRLLVALVAAQWRVGDAAVTSAYVNRVRRRRTRRARTLPRPTPAGRAAGAHGDRIADAFDARPDARGRAGGLGLARTRPTPRRHVRLADGELAARAAWARVAGARSCTCSPRASLPTMIAFGIGPAGQHRPSPAAGGDAPIPNSPSDSFDIDEGRRPGAGRGAAGLLTTGLLPALRAGDSAAMLADELRDGTYRLQEHIRASVACW